MVGVQVIGVGIGRDKLQGLRKQARIRELICLLHSSDRRHQSGTGAAVVIPEQGVILQQLLLLGGAQVIQQGRQAGLGSRRLRRKYRWQYGQQHYRDSR